MAKTIILKSILISYVALISLSKCDLLTEANTNAGLTIDLIHRDSPQSPFYNPSLSPTQRLVNAIRRSYNYIQRFNESHIGQSPGADIITSSTEYLLRYSIGTPPVISIGVVDTGSNTLWTQCQPCIKCFNQNLTIFDPKGSLTYTRLPCTSPNCRLKDPRTLCGARTNTCIYSIIYADGSVSQGALSTDILTLASTGGTKAFIPNFIFGCGHLNKEVYPEGESGVVGLGNGKVSLVRQLGYLAQGKFSYCLVPRPDILKSTSKLNFGANAEVSGTGVVSTYLARRSPYYLYFVTLVGISVGNQRLEYYKPERDLIEEGNIIVDSGTTLTWLPPEFYVKLKKALISQVDLMQIKDPTGNLDLCFYTRRDDVGMPNIIFHFHGADVNLKQNNMFVRTSDTCYCLACIPAKSHAIFGNIAQEDFLVGFDLEKRIVYFKATDCAKF